jgi:phospholipid-translocating ATPase
VAILRVSDASGTAFVRTDQLDGETDWKMKIATSFTQKLDNDMQIFDHECVIYGCYY